MTQTERVDHQLQHEVLGLVGLSVFRRGDELATVIRYGKVSSRSPTLVRIQSACLYGETLLAVDCDCRDQRDEAFRRMLENRAGLFIQLNQEGRGAGLFNKARAYELQDATDVDTVEAYLRLNLPLDSRDYGLAAEILQDVGVHRVRLLTNNLKKVEALTTSGFVVETVPLRTTPTPANVSYLRTKQARLGHMLDIDQMTSGSESLEPACVVVGAAVTDHVFRMVGAPRLGRSRQASAYERRPGGKGLNIAVALSRLGAGVTLLSASGTDDDSARIGAVLATERVRSRAVVVGSQSLSPQTGVLQPADGAPTYVGWLGDERRTLTAASVDRWASDFRGAKIVVMTLEASEEAIEHAVALAPPTALTVLSASPVAEQSYRIPTSILEDVDLVVGTADEIEGLLYAGGARNRGSESAKATIAWDLVDLLRGPSVLVTDLRQADRTITAAGPFLSRAVVVHAPRVRVTEPGDSRGFGSARGISPAVGNGDVFCAAVALELQRAADSEPDEEYWRSDRAPLARERELIDVLMLAVMPEAWVARSRGGYESFPRVGREFDTWCSQHPPAPTAVEFIDRDVRQE